MAKIEKRNLSQPEETRPGSIPQDEFDSMCHLVWHASC